MRRLARATPAGLMMYDTAGQLNAPPHIQYLNKVLIEFMRDVRAKRDPRLIINLPPRHGKTTLIGNYFPAWVAGNWPDTRIGYGGYSMDFARVQGGKARDILTNHGQHGSGLWDVEVRENAEAQHAWQTTRGGGMRTAGRGGAWTGFGFDILIFDDLVKDAKEARSVVVMEHAFDWLRSTARTRVQPGGGIVKIGTRWSKLDPGGRLIEAQQQPDWDGDIFTVINLPAIALEADPLGRAVGAPLCPQWGWTTERLRKLKASIGSIWFAALFQGDPTPDQGVIFQREDFRYYVIENAPTFPHRDAVLVLRDDPATGRERRYAWADCSVVAFMDPAMTEGALSAYTVITVWAITPNADLILVDVIRRKVEGTKHAALIDSARARWGQNLLLVVETGAYGFHAIQEQKNLGKNIRAVRAEKDKVARARVAEARYNVHKIFHPVHAPFLAPFENELLEFPLGQYKDQVDTTAYAAAWTAYGEFLQDEDDGQDLTSILGKVF